MYSWIPHCLCLFIQDPTAEDYLVRWCEEIRNPKYAFLKMQIMTYLHALMCFRGGIRRNNDDYISAGMQVLSDIMHGRNHQKYQVILLQEKAIKLAAPIPVRKFLASIQSISRSGQPNKGEGVDFQLEIYNKCSKVWLPRGVPSNEDWLRVFRLLDRLDGVSFFSLKKYWQWKWLQINKTFRVSHDF